MVLLGLISSGVVGGASDVVPRGRVSMAGVVSTGFSVVFGGSETKLSYESSVTA